MCQFWVFLTVLHFQFFLVSVFFNFAGDDLAVTVRLFCFAKVGLGFAGGASMGGDMGGLYRGDCPHPLLDISFIVVR